MTLLVVFVLVLAAVGAFFFMRRPGSYAAVATVPRSAAKKPAGPTLPSRVMNPANCAAAHPDGVWQFRTGEACCDMAKRLNNLRLETENAVTLPLPGCNPANCGCHYRPVANLRKKDRRKKMDRRDGIRMETDKEERRKGDDLRKANKAWKIGSY